MVEVTDQLPPGRYPCTGSCHCGAIKYIAYVNMPVQPPKTLQRPLQMVYRCNCTTCVKAGVMHLRLYSAPRDFALLSPLNPLADLGDYQCYKKNLHWLFCKTCGMRCFSFEGQGEIIEAELPGVTKGGEKVAFWHPVEDGWLEDVEKPHYLSVNALTLDANQKGVDLVDWTDRGAVLYFDNLELEVDGKPTPMGGMSAEKPWKGGHY